MFYDPGGLLRPCGNCGSYCCNGHQRESGQGRAEIYTLKEKIRRLKAKIKRLSGIATKKMKRRRK